MSPLDPPSRAPCPSCGHVVKSRMIRCVYCGATLAAAHHQPRRACPRCDRGLIVVSAHWLSIDRCDKCGGEFYDVNEVDAQLDLDREGRRWLESHMQPAPHDGAGGRALVCPGCRAAMNTFRVPGQHPVTIDVCPRCEGTWVDAGEVEMLRSAARARIVPKAQQPAHPAHEAHPAPPPASPEPHPEHGLVETMVDAVREIVDILRGRR